MEGDPTLPKTERAGGGDLDTTLKQLAAQRRSEREAAEQEQRRLDQQARDRTEAGPAWQQAMVEKADRHEGRQAVGREIRELDEQHSTNQQWLEHLGQKLAALEPLEQELASVVGELEGIRTTALNDPDLADLPELASVDTLVESDTFASTRQVTRYRALKPQVDAALTDLEASLKPWRETPDRTEELPDDHGAAARHLFERLTTQQQELAERRRALFAQTPEGQAATKQVEEARRSLDRELSYVSRSSLRDVLSQPNKALINKYQWQIAQPLGEAGTLQFLSEKLTGDYQAEIKRIDPEDLISWLREARMQRRELLTALGQLEHARQDAVAQIVPELVQTMSNPATNKYIVYNYFGHVSIETLHDRRFAEQFVRALGGYSGGDRTQPSDELEAIDETVKTVLEKADRRFASTFGTVTLPDLPATISRARSLTE